jgi:uncharacterized RmlC-like cupin family protein
VLEGRLVRLGEELLDASAGSFAFIPKGLTHTCQNASDTADRGTVYGRGAGRCRLR